MSKGVILFAHDNDAFEYHKLVIPCAFHVKKHLGVPIVLATDEATKSNLEQYDFVDGLIDDFILVEHESHNGVRGYRSFTETGEQVEPGEFKNKTRINLFELSPFDETIYMDIDYIVMDDSLSNLWGSQAPVRANHNIAALSKDHHLNETHVHKLGIPMYWSTVMYFNKSDEAKAVFDTIKYVHDNYKYFSRVYKFFPKLFRNDIALSIAAHTINGGSGANGPRGAVQPLPDPVMIFAWDDQPLIEVNGSKMWFLSSGSNKKVVPALVKEQSVHVVNKESVVKVLFPYVMNMLEKSQ